MSEQEYTKEQLDGRLEWDSEIDDGDISMIEYPEFPELERIKQLAEERKTDLFSLHHAPGSTTEAMLQRDLKSGSDYIDHGIADDFSKYRNKIPTGFKNLDEALEGGLSDGLYILAGGTGAGKTTFLLQLADQIAFGRSFRYGDTEGVTAPVLFINFEMSRYELVSKSLTRIASTLISKQTKERLEQEGHPWPEDLTSNKIRSHEGIDDIQFKKLVGMYYYYYGSNIFIKEPMKGSEEYTTSDLEKDVNMFINQTHSKPVIFLDYLQLMTAPKDPNGRSLSEKENTDKVVQALKQLSIQKGLPIICVSSINRGSYEDDISLKSLKESGGIEFTANTVLAYERTEDLINPRKGQLMRLSCLKNRFGEHFTCYFEYFPRYDWIREAEPPEPVPSELKKAISDFYKTPSMEKYKALQTVWTMFREGLLVSQAVKNGKSFLDCAQEYTELMKRQPEDFADPFPPKQPKEEEADPEPAPEEKPNREVFTPED